MGKGGSKRAARAEILGAYEVAMANLHRASGALFVLRGRVGGYEMGGFDDRIETVQHATRALIGEIRGALQWAMKQVEED